MCDWSSRRCSHGTVVEQMEHRAPASPQATATAVDCWVTSEVGHGSHVEQLAIAAVAATAYSPRPAATAGGGTRDGVHGGAEKLMTGQAHVPDECRPPFRLLGPVVVVLVLVLLLLMVVVGLLDWELETT